MTGMLKEIGNPEIQTHVQFCHLMQAVAVLIQCIKKGKPGGRRRKAQAVQLKFQKGLFIS